jgi:hypothetical protein
MLCSIASCLSMKQRNATIAGLLLRKGCIGAKTKVLSKKKGGLDASHHSGISRRGVEKCFFLTSSLMAELFTPNGSMETEIDYNGPYDHAQD